MAELRIGSVGMSRLAVQPSSWLGIGFLGIGGLGIGTLGIAGLGIGTLETGFVDLQVVDSTSNCHSLVMIFAMLGIAWDENDHIGDVNDSFGDINGIKPSESHILDSIWGVIIGLKSMKNDIGQHYLCNYCLKLKKLNP